MSGIDRATSSVIDEIFIALQAIFPAFKQAWPTQAEIDEAKYNWIRAFMGVGLTDVEKINCGIRRCRLLGERFPPSVGEFITMCEPSEKEFGFLSPEQAYTKAYECARERRWDSKDDVIFHAWQQSDPHFMRNNGRKETLMVFSRNYDIARKMKIRGEPLVEISKGLEAPEKMVVKNKDVGGVALKDIMKMLK